MDDRKRLKDESNLKVSKIEKARKPRGRPPGQPKSGGRKPNTLNKKTVWLRDALENQNFNFEQELITAIKTENYLNAQLLIQLLPYLNPKAKDKDIDSDAEQREETTDILALVNIRR